MKVVTILGARPQFIKAAALSKALKNHGIEEVLVHTGQHYDANMSGNFFKELGLDSPKHNLDIHGGTDTDQTARMMQALEPILKKEAPGLVIVFGDTNTTLAGALAAKKGAFSLVHIEAGMRSYLPNQAEEINRVLTDRISDLCFTSSFSASENLRKEGFSDPQIFECGDLMYDLFLQNWEKRTLAEGVVLPSRFALLTLHRQENVDQPDRLESWVRELQKLAEEIRLVCPLHPRTQKRLAAQNLNLPAQILPPLSYFQILGLLERASLVLTDSGGLQKESYFAKRPCLTLRENTEWTELLESGSNLLCSPESLAENFRAIRNESHRFPLLFGHGESAQCIAHHLALHLQGK